MGDLDALSREFAREHSDRLWKQLVVVPSDSGDREHEARTDAIVAFCLAVAAAVAIKVPALFGLQLDRGRRLLRAQREPFRAAAPDRLLRLEAAARHANGPLAGRGVRRGGRIRQRLSVRARADHTEVLTALHLPIALWLVVGIAYAGGRWSQVGGRMDFIRFSGELFIYYVLIALGGGVLTAFMALIFQAIGIDVEPFFESWLLPCGAVGAVVIASWLVEAKQSVIENMAPVLTRLFTPLFAAVLVAFLGTLCCGPGAASTSSATC